jgi:predicted phosphatase
MAEPILLAIDFDGTSFNYDKGWQGNEGYEDPMEGVEEAFKWLTDNGFLIAIFTARKKLDPVREALEKYNLDQYVSDVTNVKPPKAVVFIDDKDMIKFESWKQTIEEVKKLKLEGKVLLANETTKTLLLSIGAFISKFS